MNRKLATDIDRVLKDVTKGVELFDEIHRRVLDSDTAAKKERTEVDLKTQIKKLQRFRDQIKGWIASEEIRDKDQLVQARKTVEARMEVFKKAEKEAKTKAFSKEGLAQAEKLDPEEQMRQECRDWVNDALDSIRDQREAVQADLEALQSKKGKKNKDEIEEIGEKLKHHSLHVHSLELVLRGLDNDVLHPSEIEDIKDEVMYYVSNNGDPDFVHDDTVYEILDLDSRLGVLGKEVINDADVRERSGAKSDTTGGEDVTGTTTKVDKGSKAKRKQDAEAGVEETSKGEPLERKTRQDQQRKQQEERQRLMVEREENTRKRREQLKRESEELQSPPSPSSSPALLPPGVSKSVATAEESAAPTPWSSQTPAAAVIAAAGHHRQGSTSSTSSITAASVVANAVPNFAAAVANSHNNQPAQPKETSATSIKSDIPMSSPSAPVPLPWPTLDAAQRLALFDASYAHIPGNVDSERSKMYVPQNPFTRIPSQFPEVPAPRLESSEVFERMDVETLFFVFFHQPGTYQQFLAARELKRHDWRFHKEHQVWMQRYEEPSVTSPTLEMGTFVYFDPLSWSNKVQPNFTFDYSKMEL